MSEVYTVRRALLRDRCAAVGSAAAMVSRPANVRYLAGGAPPGAVLLLGPDEDVLVCPRAPTGDPVQGRTDDELRLALLPATDGDPVVAAADLATSSGAESLAVEEHDLTVARHRAMHAVAPRLRLADLGATVEQLRVVKDEEEIACLRIAAEITDQALGELLESILVGRTERHLALELERRLVDHGADGPAFSTSVATGPNSGQGRHRPSDRRVEEEISSPSASARTIAATGARSVVHLSSGPRRPPGRSTSTTWFSPLSGPDARPWCPAPHTVMWTARPAISWTPRATVTASRPGPGTGWGSKSTRTRSWHRQPWVNWTLVCRSPSNREFTSRAGAGSGSMTRSSCAPRRTADPSYSPLRPRSCSRSSAHPWSSTSFSPGDSATVASTNDLKNGLVLKLDGGQLWSVVEFQHVKPGKGPAFVRTKLKNVLSGKVVDKTFNAGVKVETATIDRRDMQFSYMDGEYFVFMDMDTYDQLMVDRKAVGDAANFLIEGFTASVAQHEGEVLYVELPAAVELTIQHTDPGVQGDRSTGGTKPATLETGYEIGVPLFITTGEKIKVDTRTGDYLGRVNS